MKLLSVEEVTRIWHCNRVTVLRLIRHGTLDWIEEDGEPLFDEAEVLELKNPRIAIFPHLTINRKKSPRRDGRLNRQMKWRLRYRQIAAESEKLALEAKRLCTASRLWLARSQQAAADVLAARRLVSQARDESISFRERHRFEARTEPLLGTSVSP